MYYDFDHIHDTVVKRGKFGCISVYITILPFWNPFFFILYNHLSPRYPASYLQVFQCSPLTRYVAYLFGNVSKMVIRRQKKWISKGENSNLR